MFKKNKDITKISQDDLNALKKYYCIRIPRVLKDTEVNEYDFIADNTFLCGIIDQALQGNDISKFKPIEFINSDYQVAKKIFLEKNIDYSIYYQELLSYFESYEKAVRVLDKISMDLKIKQNN